MFPSLYFAVLLCLLQVFCITADIGAYQLMVGIAAYILNCYLTPPVHESEAYNHIIKCQPSFKM